MKCRFCEQELKDVFIDLENAPASNSFLTREQLNEPEVYYPLKVYTCPKCFLVQVDEYKKSDSIFDNQYVYFSSFSKSWLKHAEDYTHMMTARFGLGKDSLVVELASNDGYLLQYFKEKDIPVLGIEPTANTAAAAREKGIESVVDFFGVALAHKLKSEGRQADLLLGNNVLAHVPDIVDFVRGMKIALKESGIITMEFPHLMQLVENNQFDTVYHEHFSYLSFQTVEQIFRAQGLVMFDVEELPTHGGSLRIFARHESNVTIPVSPRVKEMLEREDAKGMGKMTYYHHFQEKALNIKMDFIDFLLQQKRAGKQVAGYGAAAKGNTLLNYCGVRKDLVSFVVDANPFKQNKFLPGSHVPVVAEEHLKESKPDYVIIFPWNLKDEIMAQLSYIREWGGRFVMAIPEMQIV